MGTKKPQAKPAVKAKKLDKPVKYYSRKFPHLKLVIEHGVMPLYNAEGRMVREQRNPTYAKFVNSIYETDDPEIVKFIESSSPFTGRRSDGQEDELLIERAAQRSPEQEHFVNLVNERGINGAMKAIQEEALVKARAELKAEAST